MNGKSPKNQTGHDRYLTRLCFTPTYRTGHDTFKNRSDPMWFIVASSNAVRHIFQPCLLTLRVEAYFLQLAYMLTSVYRRVIMPLSPGLFQHIQV